MGRVDKGAREGLVQSWTSSHGCGGWNSHHRGRRDVCEGTELEVRVSKSTGVRYGAENQVGDFGLLSRGQRKRNDIQNKHFITKRKKERK